MEKRGNISVWPLIVLHRIINYGNWTVWIHRSCYCLASFQVSFRIFVANSSVVWRTAAPAIASSIKFTCPWSKSTMKPFGTCLIRPKVTGDSKFVNILKRDFMVRISVFYFDPKKVSIKLSIFIAEGLKITRVNNYDEIEHLMTQGTINRTVASTNMNATSSRGS